MNGRESIEWRAEYAQTDYNPLNTKVTNSTVKSFRTIYSSHMDICHNIKFVFVGHKVKNTFINFNILVPNVAVSSLINSKSGQGDSSPRSTW